MKLATSIFGAESRLAPLIKAALAVTALRALWIAINVWQPGASTVAWALVPWPWLLHSWMAWTVDFGLALYQVRAIIRLGRVLELRFAPRRAAVPQYPGGDNPTPRNRSWWPTALLLCGTLVLTCCALSWIVLMLWYGSWAPFDAFMTSRFANNPLLVGLGLSVLGLIFGRRYIASAASDVSTNFRVKTVGDDHWLTERVYGIADRLNLPRPAVGITDVVNAFAMGASQQSAMVVIGRPLFVLRQDELDAIIGHELGHVLHHDVARMQFAEGFQRLLVNTVNALTVVGLREALRGEKDLAKARWSRPFARFIGFVTRKAVFVASEMVARGISRNREFHADAVGAHVTSADAMARALRRIHGATVPPTPAERHYGYLMFRGSAFGNLFSTHPTLEARLRALDAYAKPRDAARQASSAKVDGVHGSRQENDEAKSLAGLDGATHKHATSSNPTGSVSRPALPSKVNSRRLLLTGAACALVLVAVPAVVSFYVLDHRLHDIWFGDGGYTQRMRQLEAREQAVKVAETQLAADRNAAMAARDQAVAAARETQQKLNSANAERAVLMARLQAQTGTSPAVSQPQIASLTEQLSRMTADRDEFSRQNEALRQANAALEQQSATQQSGLVDLGKQNEDLQNQIAELTLGPPGDAEDAAPAQGRTNQPQGAYGAFAAAGNGVVILTDRRFATSQAASDAALAECGRFSGTSLCTVQKVFRDTCAAVARVIPATTKSRYEIQFGATPADAEDTALSKCFQRNGRPCEVTRQVCVR